MESLWVAKTGLDAQQTRMTVVSNNLANVNTNGFKKGRAMFEDLLYQNVSQAGGATSQDTEQPTGLNLGTGVRVVATEKTFTQGSHRQHRQSLRRDDQRSRLLPGAAAGRQPGLHPRRLLQDRLRGPRSSRHPATKCSPSITIPSGVTSLTIADGRPDPGHRHGPGRAGDARHPADRRLHQPGRPAAAGPEPAGRDRRQRHAAGRQSRPRGPRRARAGLARGLQRQRRRGTGEHDRDAARLRDELEGHRRPATRCSST